MADDQLTFKIVLTSLEEAFLNFSKVQDDHPADFDLNFGAQLEKGIPSVKS